MSDYLFKCLLPGKHSGVDVIGIVFIDNYADKELAAKDYPEIKNICVNDCFFNNFMLYFNLYQQPKEAPVKTTLNTLQSMVNTINRVTNSPAEYLSKTEAGFTHSVGHYHLSRAYGGVSLHQTVNTSGGARDVFNCGHVKNMELLIRM